jgi:calmodulin
LKTTKKIWNRIQTHLRKKETFIILIYTRAHPDLAGDSDDMSEINTVELAEKNNLSPEEVAEFKEIFDLVDKDGGGSISKDELKELMETLGLRPTDDELDAMMAEVDGDGSGDIDFEEFVYVMSRKVQADYTPDQLRSAFRVFETPGCPPGFVSTDVLERALTTYGPDKLSLDEAAELLATVDHEGTGKINYVELISLMTDQKN